MTPGDGDVIDSSTEGGHDVVIVELGGTARIVQQLDQPAFKTVKAKAAPAAAGGGGEQGSGDGAAAPQAAAPPQAPSRRPRLEPLKSLNIFLSLREHSFLAYVPRPPSHSSHDSLLLGLCCMVDSATRHGPLPFAFMAQHLHAQAVAAWRDLHAPRLFLARRVLHLRLHLRLRVHDAKHSRLLGGRCRSKYATHNTDASLT